MMLTFYSMLGWYRNFFVVVDEKVVGRALIKFLGFQHGRLFKGGQLIYFLGLQGRCLLTFWVFRVGTSTRCWWVLIFEGGRLIKSIQ